MQPIRTWAGIDVSNKTLAVSWSDNGVRAEREFANDGEGHRELIKCLGKSARVCMEATGSYHLQLALALRKARVEVMVVNPRVAKAFAGALSNRSKTDAVDARTLLGYVERMEFRAWEAPRQALLDLRELSRRQVELTRMMVQEKNRVHAKQVGGINAMILGLVRQHIGQLEESITEAENAAFGVIQADADLRELYGLLLQGQGIGKRSVIQLLGELALLDPTMTTRQIVAYAGLDPRVFQSGTSVDKTPRISKAGNARLRATLYMCALSAIRHDRGARLFYARMVARGKEKMQATVAVMRKLLHGVWIVIQRRVAFDNSVLFAASLAQAESSDSAVAAHQPEPEQDHPKGRSNAEELRQQLEPAPVEATRSPRRRSKADDPQSAVQLFADGG